MSSVGALGLARRNSYDDAFVESTYPQKPFIGTNDVLIENNDDNKNFFTTQKSTQKSWQENIRKEIEQGVASAHEKEADSHTMKTEKTLHKPVTKPNILTTVTKPKILKKIKIGNDIYQETPLAKAKRTQNPALLKWTGFWPSNLNVNSFILEVTAIRSMTGFGTNFLWSYRKYASNALKKWTIFGSLRY